MSKASDFLKKILTLELTHSGQKLPIILYMRRYISPEHWSGLILFVDQLSLGRDMCPEELVDAARDGLAKDGGVVE